MNPKSIECSNQDVENMSNETFGAIEASFVIMLINPPTASLPYKLEAGPFTISIRSINEFGIPDKP